MKIGSGKLDNEKQLSRYSTIPLSNFIVLLMLGLIFANNIFLYVSTIPLFFFMAGLFIDTPSDVTVKREISKDKIKKGDEVKVSTQVIIKNGIGLFTVSDMLPESFEITRGSNIQLFWKGFGESKKTYSYTVKCPKRGTFQISGIDWTANHVLKMKKPMEGSIDKNHRITVHPFSSQVQHLKEHHLGEIPIPRADVTKMGISTTDFKEVRHYNYGDPLKLINWNATAKRGPKKRPLVNEYEKEGKKTVWIFLDASSDLRVGTSIDNIFEHCVEAADGFARFFTEKRYLVGMYIINSGKKMFYPETGKKQHNKIKRELLKLDSSTTSNREGLDDAVQECKSFLYRHNPLPIIITNMYQQDEESFKSGCNQLRSILGGRRKDKIPLIILNVLPYSMDPSPDDGYKKNAVLFDVLENYPLKSYVKGIGGRVIEWDPTQEKFLKSFMRGVKSG